MAYTTINNSKLYQNTMLYTGDDGTRNITESGTFQADLVWLKRRNSPASHHLVDSVRGATKAIYSNATGAEATDSTGVTGFVTDGFSLGGQGGYNNNGDTFVSWTWKAGASQTLNSGSVTSTVRANTTAGFSIVKWTGTAGNILVSHGLGVIPKVVMIKNLSNGSAQWVVYHVGTGNTKACYLNTTATPTTASGFFNNSTPDATDFIVSSDTAVNGSGNSMIAYCFADVQGYSKFSSYTGNGNADGSFVYTGFKPAFLMIKDATGSGEWLMWDNKRSPSNEMTKAIAANDSLVEDTTKEMDFLSNGFKIRTTDTNYNASSNTNIYMAFGQSIVGTNGVTAKAR
jgi:hypothetical protein